MNCKRCGASLDIGQKFCGKCGCSSAGETKISQADMQKLAEMILEMQKSQTPPKKKSKKPMIIAVIATSLLLIAAVAAYFIADSIQSDKNINTDETPGGVIAVNGDITDNTDYIADEADEYLTPLDENGIFSGVQEDGCYENRSVGFKMILPQNSVVFNNELIAESHSLKYDENSIKPCLSTDFGDHYYDHLSACTSVGLITKVVLIFPKQNADAKEIISDLSGGAEKGYNFTFKNEYIAGRKYFTASYVDEKMLLNVLCLNQIAENAYICIGLTAESESTVRDFIDNNILPIPHVKIS